MEGAQKWVRLREIDLPVLLTFLVKITILSLFHVRILQKCQKFIDYEIHKIKITHGSGNNVKGNHQLSQNFLFFKKYYQF